MRLALLLALLAPAASAQVAARLDDLRLATAVRLALVDDARTRALDVTVAARDGSVDVLGDVPPLLEPIAADVARAVPGVRTLRGLGGDTAGPATRIDTRPPDRPARPAEPVRPSDAGPLYHTVERGDTLFSLARRYGTTVDAIQRLNDRTETGIRVGQRLRVR
ncbi:LysM peptidoglycan-binding domain-containing protein [Rubrivirga sp.]|uniref:LysM peptidoglycan-binding domain-containing protein n=1 Tax=Rubrivirga sp. TaxID=1885344 RepID=UPI003B52901B